MNKNNYILKSLRKIAHKEWELFVISRVIHGLNDDEVEFITQQLVLRPNGERALTDLYFPQFSVHLEIDEGHHNQQIEADDLREKDIITVTDHIIERIRITNQDNSDRSLSEIRKDVDEFIMLIHRMKHKQVASGKFTPWDFEMRYSAKPHISRGHISIKGNAVFKTQVEALRCFGFTGKGWQRGAWCIPDNTNDVVWFPRLYEHGMWKNELTDDGKTILERAQEGNEDAKESIRQQRADDAKYENRKWIVFAKAKDSLGFNLLRYVGTFVMNTEDNSPEVIRFDRVSETEAIRPAVDKKSK